MREKLLMSKAELARKAGVSPLTIDKSLSWLSDIVFLRKTRYLLKIKRLDEEFGKKLLGCA